ncbi:hypothetical protein EDD22DRAFT_845388 [Suillus occidentalis]|nr:hypothetical protein EDD22DRAFT_845388 [Suillus occidentalis]
MSEAAQRGGRAVRDGQLWGLYLLMVETWALDVELMEEHTDDSDPDKPYAGILKKNSSKKDRTGCAVLRYAQSTTCLWECFAKYLGDQTPTGQTHTSEDAQTMPSTKRKRTKLQDKELHKPLLAKLKKWRTDTHFNDPLQSVWPITWLCDDNSLEILSKTNPDNLRTVDNIIKLLEETEEWGKDCGQQILKVIARFDKENLVTVLHSHLAKKTRTSVTA